MKQRKFTFLVTFSRSSQSLLLKLSNISVQSQSTVLTAVHDSIGGTG